MRSEFSANKALFETAFSNTFQVAKKIASCVNSKAQSKLSDMQSMKEFQAKNNVFGKAMFVVD